MTDDKEGKKEYIVREGRTFGVNNTPAGESVWLTELEAAPFLDLIEPRVKQRKHADTAAEEDTRDMATNEKNIGVKTGDKGTPREAASGKK